jgi:phosphoribosyl-ATP pyrophosphohydrolase
MGGDWNGIIDMNQILDKQKQLEEKAPHKVTSTSYRLMKKSITEIQALLVFINSTGRKPWRPNPLPFKEIAEKERQLLMAQDDLLEFWEESVRDKGTSIYASHEDRKTHLMILTLGIIEEALEFYQDASAETPDQAKVLEEITDILFFYMVGMLQTGLTWEDIIKRYHLKWEENMGRYQKLEVGDTSWDKRSEKGASL